MALRNDIKTLVVHWKTLKDTLEHNSALFEIYEGNLLPYVLADLKAQLSQKSYDMVVHRVAPINILRRLIYKLSKIYSKPPVRNTEGGSDKDTVLLGDYVEQLDANTVMSNANEFFNLFKTTAIEPYLDRGEPRLRIIPSDRFFVYSNDPVNPMRPTHFVKIMGKIKRGMHERTLFFAYTDSEFLAFDDNNDVVDEIMQRPDIAILDGKNPYGAIPVVYINRSKHDLTPKVDSDTLAMTKLIPVLLSDLNYAVMFQAFSIIYGIDLDNEGLKMAPNAFWNFKSDPDVQTKPQIGVIKPDVNIDQVIRLIRAEVAFWLQSRNIKPGAMGDLSVESLPSGISKAIDEMDTSEDRQRQTSFFKDAERVLFDLIINKMHPVWMRDPNFKMKQSFTPGFKVTAQFSEQHAMVNTSTAIADQVLKLTNGIQSKYGALQELYPDWDDAQIMEKLEEIQEEKQIEAQALLDAPKAEAGVDGQDPNDGVASDKGNGEQSIPNQVTDETNAADAALLSETGG